MFFWYCSHGWVNVKLKLNTLPARARNRVCKMQTNLSKHLRLLEQLSSPKVLVFPRFFRHHYRRPAVLINHGRARGRVGRGGRRGTERWPGVYERNWGAAELERATTVYSMRRRKITNMFTVYLVPFIAVSDTMSTNRQQTPRAWKRKLIEHSGGYICFDPF